MSKVTKETKSKEKKPSVIEQSIIGEDSKQEIAEKIFGQGEDLPVVRSVGYSKIPGTSKYISYIIHTKGTEVIKVEVDEPNMRPIAEESAKLNFVNLFMTGDGED